MDKDTERMKIEIVANYFLGAHINLLILGIAAFTSLLVALYSAYLASLIPVWLFLVTSAVIVLGVVYVTRMLGKTFKSRIGYFDTLIVKLDNNEPLGTLKEIINKAPE